MHELVDSAAIAAFRSRALNPMHPHQRGTSQDSSVYFQMVESVGSFSPRRLGRVG